MDTKKIKNDIIEAILRSGGNVVEMIMEDGTSQFYHYSVFNSAHVSVHEHKVIGKDITDLIVEGGIFNNSATTDFEATLETKIGKLSNVTREFHRDYKFVKYLPSRT